MSTEQSTRSATGRIEVQASPEAVWKALTDAADQDRATGGVDLQRGIYPIVQFCTEAGIERASDEDVAAIYRTLMEERTR